MVKNLPFNPGDTSSVPSLGPKIPHAVGQLSSPTTTTEPAHSEDHMPQLEKPVHHNEEPTHCNEDIMFEQVFIGHGFLARFLGKHRECGMLSQEGQTFNVSRIEREWLSQTYFPFYTLYAIEALCRGSISLDDMSFRN